MRLTTQPIEEPADRDELAQVLAMMSAERTVMSSSDYPHWDNDDPSRVLRRLAPDVRARILGGTAAELYGLDARPERTTNVPRRERAPGPGSPGNAIEAME